MFQERQIEAASELAVLSCKVVAILFHSFGPSLGHRSRLQARRAELQESRTNVPRETGKVGPRETKETKLQACRLECHEKSWSWKR